jgi:stress-induced morphogen
MGNDVKNRMISKLTECFLPLHLDLINESHQHSVPVGSQTHFKCVIVADRFESMKSVQRHQAVYACLGDDLRSGVHALALHTYSPTEWLTIIRPPVSPPCLGGGSGG